MKGFNEIYTKLAEAKEEMINFVDEQIETILKEKDNCIIKLNPEEEPMMAYEGEPLTYATLSEAGETPIICTDMGLELYSDELSYDNLCQLGSMLDAGQYTIKTRDN